jgi:molybdopterin-synthase adenylyltransferase
VNKPRIKHVHFPTRLSDGRIRMGAVQYGVAAEISGDEEGALWRLLGLMDGTRDVAALVADSGPTVDAASVRGTIDALIASGFVEDAAAPTPAQLTEAELERYTTNTRYFAWVDTQPRSSPYELQRRLKEARVAVLGLGGTGGAVATSLAAAGVGSLLCLDFDVVELSNLSRQLLYRDEDVGRPKVEAAVRRIQEVNPHVEVRGRELRATSAEDLHPIMDEVDFFVLCADQPQRHIQLWTNEAALRTGTPWSVCAYDGPMIVTAIFDPFRSACMECFLAWIREDDLRRDGGRVEPLLPPPPNAVIAPAANASGHVGALEVVYYITGLSPQTVGRMLHQDLMHYDNVYYIEPAWREDCPACGGRTGPGERRPIPFVHA